MIVYKPRPAEGYQWVMPLARHDIELLKTLPNRPLDGEWAPVRVELITENEDGRPRQQSDMPWHGSHALVLTSRARTALGGVLGSDAELLPLECEDEELWLVHVWRMIDALDEQRSRVRRFEDSGRIWNILEYSFREESLTGVNCFKLPQLKVSQTFVTDQVVEAARRAGLRGVNFRPVWHSDGRV